MFQEEPLFFQETSICGCKSGALLTEHVTISMKLALSRASHKDQNLISELSSGANEFVSFQSTAVQDGFWSTDVVIEMITVAAISAVDICRLYRNNSVTYDDYYSPIRISYLVFDALSRIPLNAHGIVETKSILASNDSVTEDINSSRVGVAIFTTASAMNHSCKPNCIVRYKRCTARSPLKYVLEIVTTESIAINDECTISYGPIWGYHRFLFRQRVLQSQYLFSCRCRECRYEIKGMVESYDENNEVKSSTGKALSSLITEIREEVTRLKSLLTFSTTNNDKIVALLNKAYVFFAQVTQKNKSGAILEKLRELTMIHCEFYDYCAFNLAEKMKFDEAAEYVRHCIDMFVRNQVYSDSDVPIARERVKLAQLYFSSSKYREAFQVAKVAHKRLTETVPDDDPDILSCVSILRDSSIQL